MKPSDRIRILTPFGFAALMLSLPSGVNPQSPQPRTVPVTVVVFASQRTMSESLAGLELTITPLSGGASALLTTDSTGRASTQLAPGRYRVRSLNPIRLGGIEHNWDMEISVTTHYASAAILLNSQNANVPLAIQSPSAPIPAPASAPSVRRTTALMPTDPGYRDPNMALLFGILLTGGGHIYSGEVLAGVGFLVGTGILVGTAIGTCGYNSCDADMSAGLITAAAALVIYSWVDAPAAAKRTNRKGFPNITLGPGQLRPTANGLAFSIPLP